MSYINHQRCDPISDVNIPRIGSFDIGMDDIVRVRLVEASDAVISYLQVDFSMLADNFFFFYNNHT